MNKLDISVETSDAAPFSYGSEKIILMPNLACQSRYGLLEIVLD